MKKFYAALIQISRFKTLQFSSAHYEGHKAPVLFKRNRALQLLSFGIIFFFATTAQSLAQTISGFTPSGGCAGSSQVVISGTGFTGATAVLFGESNAASFTINSDTQITAIPADGVSGAISVITPGGTAASADVFTVNARPTGVLSGDQTLCSAATGTLTLSVTGSGTISGTLSNGVSFSGIAPTIFINVSPAATTTYTIATLTNGCVSLAADKTGSAVVNVLSAISSGSIASGNQTICFGGDPADITLSSLPSGGTGNFTYQWYYKDGAATCPSGTSTAGWILIPGATGSSYDPPAGLNASRTYAVQIDATGTPDCGVPVWAANCRKITVKPAFDPGTITFGDEAICPGGDPANISLSPAPSGANGLYTYQWYYRDGTGSCPTGTGTAGWTAISATGTGYNPPAGLMVSRTYAVQIDPTGTPDCAGPTWANNCRQVTVNPLPSITPAASASAVCFSTAAQTTTLSYSGATNAPVSYSISWSASPANSFPAVSNATLPAGAISITVPANTAPGNYTGTITVKNANGCTSAGTGFTLTVNELPAITAAASAASVCTSTIAQTTSLTYNTTANAPDTYSIAWNASPVSNFAVVTNEALPAGAIPISVPANTAPGTYTGTITVKNANGCISAGTTFTVTVNSLPAGTITAAENSGVANDNNICPGTPVTFTVSPAFTKHVFKINGTIVQSGLPNSYTTSSLTNGDVVTVEVTNINNCVASFTASPVTVASSVAGTLTADKNVICAGKPVIFTADPGYANYVFKVNGSSVQAGNSNVYNSGTTLTANATVTVDVTNSNGCSGTFSPVTITVDPLPAGTLSAAETSGTTANDNRICAGATVFFTATAGFSNYTFKINGTSVQDGPLNTYSNAALTNGALVQVEVSNSNGCAATLNSIIITVNALPSPIITASEASGTSNDNIICAGANVKFTVTPTGLSNYNFKVNGTSVQSGASNAFNIYVLKAGDLVAVDVTNANGCTSTVNAAPITVNPVPAVTSPNTAAMCSGSNTAINLTSDIPANFSWTVGTITGGVTGATNGSGNNINQVLTNPSAVSAGSVQYIITAVSKSGTCSGLPYVITVTVNPAPEVTSPNNAIVCSGATAGINLTASVPATFTWTVGDITGGITGASDGAGPVIDQVLTNPGTTAGTVQYIVKPVSAAGACTGAPDTITVTVNPVVALSSPLNPAAICSESIFTYVPASNVTGASYSWSRAGVAGIDEPAANGTGNISEVLTNTTQAPVVVTYVYTIISNGCSNPGGNVMVTVNPLPSATLNGPNPICQGSAGNLYTTETGNGEHNYVWTIANGVVTAGGTSTDNSVTVTWSGAGTKSINVNYTDVNGCSAATSASVTNSPSPSLPTISGPSSVCLNSNNNVYTTEAGSTFSDYVWTVNGGTITSGGGLSDNTATVTWTSAGSRSISVNYADNGCSSVSPTTKQVTVNSLPVLVVHNPAAVCSPAAADITVAAITAGSGAGLTFTYWSDAAATIPYATPATAGAGTYYIKGTSPSGCFDIKPVTVTVKAMPSLVINNPAAVCSPSTADLTLPAVTAGSSAGLTYTYWTNAAATAAYTTPGAAGAGTYYIKGTNASGCYAVNQVTVAVNNKPAVTTHNQAVCSPATVNLADPAVTTGSTAGLSYTYWTDAAATVSYNTPATAGTGTYYLKGTNGTGCYDVQPVTVTVSAAPTVTISNPSPVCTPATADLTSASITSGSSTGLSYTFWTDAGANSSFATPSAAGAGTYYIKGTTAAGCFDTKPVTVSVNTPPAAPVITPAGATICQGAVQPLSSGTNSSIINQTFTSGTINLTIPDITVTGAASTIAVTGIPAGAVINSMSVSFNIAHTNVGDLRINLKAPNNNVLNLANREGGTGNDYINTTISSSAVTSIIGAQAPFTNTYKAGAASGVSGATGVAGNTSNVAAFSSLFSVPNGNWVFSARDVSTGTTGTITNWSLTINYTVAIAQPVTWSPATDLYTDPGATTAYTGQSIATVYAKPSSSGSKTYTATATNAAGCTSTATTTLSVNLLPGISVTADYCAVAGKVRLTASSTPSGAAFVWNTGQTGPVIDVDVANTYIVVGSFSSGCSATGSISVAQELVENGDFSAGNTGFTTEYVYTADTAGIQTELLPEGLYSVGTSGQNYHHNFYGKEHTTTGQSGNFMLVNGSTTLIGSPAHLRTIWQETVTVLPNTDYYFSAYAMNLNPSAPAKLQFEVNGVAVGTIADLTTAPKPTADGQVNINNWVRFYSNPKWNSGSATTAVIRIVNLNTVGLGNDFGLDDISFATLSTFVTRESAPGTDAQTLCINTPLTNIVYSVGSSATGPLVTGLPAGVTSSFNGDMLTISGTPAVAGTYHYTVTTQGSCNPATAIGTITVTAQTISLSSGNAGQSVCVNTPVTHIVYAVGGSATGAAVTGLPAGVTGTFNNGLLTISGTPSEGGTFNYTVTTTGTCNPAAIAGTMTVQAQTITYLAGSSSQTVCRNSQIDNIAYTVGGTGASVTGLPSGVTGSYNNGVFIISGTPVIAGTFNYTVTTTGNCSQPAVITGTIIVPAGSWTGALSNDWADAGNWCGGVPDASSDVTIAAGTPHDPVISGGTFGVHSISLLSGASLTIDSSAVLVIKGIYSNTGVLANDGRIILNGAAPQSFPGSNATVSAMNQLEVDNAAGVLIDNAMTITGMLIPTAGNINLSNNIVTLKSTAANTASVPELGPTASFTYGANGAFSVERYIAAKRAWRFLSVPTGTNQTVKSAWQEGAVSSGSNPVPGYGTQVTNAVNPSAANGFDYYSPDGPSVKKYDVTATGAYAPYKSISTTYDPIATKEGLMTFVRGDRTSTGLGATPKPTVLRTQGPLYTGPQAPMNVNANQFASIGNPYASPLDMRKISKTEGVNDNFYLWDAKLTGSLGFGAFQTFTLIGNDYIPTPGGGSYPAQGPKPIVTPYNYIESGMAFFADAHGNTGGTVTLTENAKAASSTSTAPFSLRPVSIPDALLRTNLYAVEADASTSLVDGVLSDFGDYNNSVDHRDAIKIANFSENLSLKTDDQLLVVERRHMVQQADTIRLNMLKMKVKSYRFEILGQNFNQPGLIATLEDSYLNTHTVIDVNGATIYDFTVINVPGSWNPSRFTIVFKQAVVLPVTFTSVKAYQLNKDVSVEWKVENEKNIKQYEVERSADGQHFTRVATATAKQNSGGSASYQWLDGMPLTGNNYYRIRSVNADGGTAYSAVVKVLSGNVNSQITVYPNPVTDGRINLHLINQPKGKYGVRLMNKTGQLILVKQIDHEAGTSAEALQIKLLAHGIYHLEVMAPDMTSTNISVHY